MPRAGWITALDVSPMAYTSVGIQDLELTMDDRTLQKKLNQLVALSNELHDEAVRRYGPTGLLFYESEGTFHVMRDDGDFGIVKRQEFVEFSSSGRCKLGAGAW